MQDVPKIVIARLKAAAPLIEHPDADLLTAFAEQSLPTRERELVLQHIARCSDCREIIALALPPMEAVPAEPMVPARSGWLTWPALRRGLAAAGVVLIASLGILQYRRTTAPSMMAYKSPEIARPEPRAQIPVQSPAAPVATNSDKSIPAPASADSLSITNENVTESKTRARAAVGSAAVGSVTKRPEYGGGVAGGVISGAQLPHGPKMPAQWQQNNNSFQLQSSNNPASAPAPAPQNAGASVAGTIAAASPAATVEVRNSAPQLDTLAQNQEMQLPAKEFDHLVKAKPAEPASVAVISAGPGQVGGSVVDPTGAAVPNARITVTSSGTGLTATAVTNSQGAWLIVGLPTGSYKARAEAQGFNTTVADLSYDASRPLTYRFMLNVGSVAESVEVAAAQNGQVQADATSFGGPISNREVLDAPLNGRNATQLTPLSPGVAKGSLPRWTITSSGILQRSFDQGNTWQTVDVNANAGGVSSLQLATNQPASTQPVAVQSMAKQKNKDRKVSTKEASTPSFRAVAAAGAEVWAGGSAAALYYSSDAGNNWSRVQPSSGSSVLAGDIVSLDFPDAQHVKITTSASEVWTTSDAGQTWQKH